MIRGAKGALWLNNNLKKLTWLVNTVILTMVFALMAIFYVIKAEFLVYFSIPTAFVYLIGYALIHTNHLHGYVCMVYFWLTIYMGIATICLGYGYGFHLYSMSMIPIIHYTVYMARAINAKYMKAIPVSIAIAVCYLVSTLLPAFNGPIYTTDANTGVIFWIINSVTVFAFLIFYTNFLIKAIVHSEECLEALAMEDNLTGLYNRHYMMGKLEEMKESDETSFVAIIDIDDFKKINDNYGHNAGDHILKSVAETMSAACKDYLVCRWGGEEFLILGQDIAEGRSRMEEIRENVESTVFIFEEQTIRVTLTVGMAARKEAKTTDKWVQVADDRLYTGKNTGKNKVVIE
ncbi:MAG: GGDEF domain-containing protein [Lachnospiraceae bacterium]|nr:GGDEF domain-containing protein [Lachnospiraceae bacterium]